ncbi:hypothetical protein HWC14_gp82 [Serratia phage Parlo]|uniref:Uncharacterized protein n=1 Tax=Serratia phage Parlo TaxID=2557554 RepID=A0A482MFN4_9CAUD|nr:hypothetical protein HWC14_gp82 [Serratia phage Parlo]QBQ72231.1 hypothetical protein CPT_Parlo_082 [Serratia phage Parlo]
MVAPGAGGKSHIPAKKAQKNGDKKISPYRRLSNLYPMSKPILP